MSYKRLSGYFFFRKKKNNKKSEQHLKVASVLTTETTKIKKGEKKKKREKKIKIRNNSYKLTADTHGGQGNLQLRHSHRKAKISYYSDSKGMGGNKKKITTSKPKNTAVYATENIPYMVAYPEE